MTGVRLVACSGIGMTGISPTTSNTESPLRLPIENRSVEKTITFLMALSFAPPKLGAEFILLSRFAVNPEPPLIERDCLASDTRAPEDFRS
jgi:hypothetical protein